MQTAALLSHAKFIFRKSLNKAEREAAAFEILKTSLAPSNSQSLIPFGEQKKNKTKQKMNKQKQANKQENHSILQWKSQMPDTLYK